MDARSLPQRLFRQLVPPARKPVTWPAVAPLLAFLFLFLVLIVFLEWRGLVRFSYRPAFALILVTPWIWWLHHAGGSGLGKGRALTALLVRLCLAGGLVMLLAEPRAVRRSDTLSVVYALDVSDSMGEKVSDQALDWILRTIKQKPQDDEAGLVVFGRDAGVELPPRPSFPFEAIQSRVTRDGSNLAQALALSAAMLPEEHQGRIVLISDGNETDGNVLAQLDELKARGIAVDVLPIGFAYDREVWLERLDLPRVVKAGETYEASVLLNALQRGTGKLLLQENGRTIFEKPVAFEPGKTRFTLPIYLRAPGFYEYAASLEVPPGEDGWKENNLAIGDLFLRGEAQVLLVTDPQSDARDWEPFAEALKASERLVQVRMAYEFPRDALSLQPYDLIVFANAPADAFDAVQLRALRDAAYNNGTGFLMLGGPQSFGPGGYHRTAVEEALPVTMDVEQKKALPSGALLIVLDRSGSMAAEVAGRSKISLANRGAVLALKTLSAQDFFGVFAVDTQAHRVIPMGKHGALSEEAVGRILGIDAGGGGIYIHTSLSEAARALREVDANIRHVILFSDAADAEQQTAATGGGASGSALDLAAAMAAAKITISVVALGQAEDKDTGFLQQLAQRGQGRFYLTNDATNLPQIFIKEAITLKRSMLQNRVFTPEVALPSPVLKGINAMPPLRGYVLSTIKPRATTILRTPETKEQPGERDPVLATWRFGLGVTAAWTSDLGPAWAKDWLDWEKYRAFVKQLAIELSRVEAKTALRLQTFAAGNAGVITVEDFAKEEAFLEVEARVAGPRGETVNVPLRQIGPRRYQGQFPLWGKGRYQVVAAAAGRADADQPEQAMSGFAVPYSPEYLEFRSDPIVLKQIAERTGGRLLNSASTDLFTPHRQPRESTLPIIDWFLLVLACLVPIDVAVRRVQLDWDAVRSRLRRRAAETSGETMGALLHRKKRVGQTLDPVSHEPGVAPAAPTAPLVRPARTVAPTPRAAAAETPAPPAAVEPTSTTGQLLARKRRRQGGEPPAG